MSLTKTSIRIFVPIALIALAIGVGAVIVKTTQKPEKKRPQRTAYAAEVVELKAGSQAVRLRATGVVAPASQITLRSRVAGEIIEASPEFIDGGRFEADGVILKIDPVDYRLALEQKKAALAEAEYQLKLEQGQRDIAAREWELMDSDSEASDSDRELALRVPHLNYRTARLAAAKAELEKASLDLARTEVRAPFNAVVVERRADLGAQVSLQDSIALLANSDSFYVRASIPVDRLKWIRCDSESGSAVTIRRGTGAARQGHVIRLESSLEEMGRMARVLIAVEDPLSGDHPMLLNEYVNVEIEGTSIASAYLIPRAALRDDQFVWVATPESALEIRAVEVAWRDAENVIISSGLQDGERLILTNLSTPINGMKLRIAGDTPPEPTPKGTEKETRGKGPKRHA